MDFSDSYSLPSSTIGFLHARWNKWLVRASEGLLAGFHITAFNEVPMYGFLADLMVGIHVSYVAYVVLGQLLIWVGLIFGWRWVRNLWFRLTHFLAIGIVVYEELFDIRCPLTVWEEELRLKAGQSVTGETFLGRLLHSLIFYDFQPWVFTVLYLTMGSLVLLTFIVYPPRRRNAE